MKITKKQLEQNVQNLQTQLDQLNSDLKPDQHTIAKIAEELWKYQLSNNNGRNLHSPQVRTPLHPKWNTHTICQS
jgi:dynactin complex subunit